MATKRAPVRTVPFRTVEPTQAYPGNRRGAHPGEDAKQVEAANQADDLVRRARSGDSEAFALLYERFHPPVFRFLLARVGNRIEAEDMAAEVFVEAGRRVRNFHGSGAAFAGWLFTIARHDLLDRGRALRRRLVVPVSDVPDVEVVPDPADRVVEMLDAGRVRGALDSLTDEQRDVVLLKFAAGLSNEEVAETLGKPIGAVKSLQHRGLAALKRALLKDTTKAAR
ncbi:MAG: RNA polymerase sigma factor [Actinomycetota bacterium]|nr:RNA polymerase sigma factor [Actinomycetota bacterium]